MIPALKEHAQANGKFTSVAVNVSTLDLELVGTPRVDLLKIDVEGWERFVLQGAQQLIRRCRPIIVLEIWEEHMHNAGVTASQLDHQLASLGYTCSLVQDVDFRNVQFVASHDNMICRHGASNVETALVHSLTLYKRLRSHIDVFKARADWAQLFAALEFSRGAQIGVWDGGSLATAVLMRVPSLKQYILVDPWVNNHEHEQLYNEAKQRIESNPEFGSKLSLLRQTSSKAATLIDDSSLDFVYIYSDHTAKGIAADLTPWIRKVKPGGLICGDGYLGGNPHGNGHSSSTTARTAIHGVAEALGAQAFSMGAHQFGFMKP